MYCRTPGHSMTAGESAARGQWVVAVVATVDTPLGHTGAAAAAPEVPVEIDKIVHFGKDRQSWLGSQKVGVGVAADSHLMGCWEREVVAAAY